MIMKRFSVWRIIYPSVQSLSHVQLCDPWAMACQASLSITNSRSLLKFMSLKLVMPSNHLILCCPLLLPSIFPSIRVFFFFFPVSQFFATGGHSIGASTSESVFPVNIQYWFPLGLTEASTWRRKWQPTPVFLPRESCGQRSLVGCCP